VEARLRPLTSSPRRDPPSLATNQVSSQSAGTKPFVETSTDFPPQTIQSEILSSTEASTPLKKTTKPAQPSAEFFVPEPIQLQPMTSNSSDCAPAGIPIAERDEVNDLMETSVEEWLQEEGEIHQKSGALGLDAKLPATVDGSVSPNNNNNVEEEESSAMQETLTQEMATSVTVLSQQQQIPPRCQATQYLFC